MTYLLAAEWLKMRKRWMPRILLLIMLALIALLFWGIGTSPQQRVNLFLPRGWLMALLLSASIAPFLWPILAGSWAGNEYGWGTIRTVLTHRPGRPQFVLAGVVTVMSVVGLSLVAAMALGTLAGAIVAGVTGHSAVDTTGIDAGFFGTLLKMLFASWYALGFYVVLAYAAGTLFRSGAVGIGAGIGIIVAELVVRGILFAIGGTWRDISDHFPTQYTNALITRVSSGGFRHDFTSVSSSTPGVTESIIALGIYIAVPLIVALVLIRTRDVTS